MVGKERPFVGGLRRLVEGGLNDRVGQVWSNLGRWPLALVVGAPIAHSTTRSVQGLVYSHRCLCLSSGQTFRVYETANAGPFKVAPAERVL